MDSINDTLAGGVLYRIPETAKANELKPYEYFRYLLEQMIIYFDDEPKDYMEDLAPWSDKIQNAAEN